jgi:hypothetical protein
VSSSKIARECLTSNGTSADWAIVHEVCDQQAKRVTLSDYDIIIPAIPPFYWPRFARLYSKVAGLTRRSPDALFYQDEQEY